MGPLSAHLQLILHKDPGALLDDVLEAVVTRRLCPHTPFAGCKEHSLLRDTLPLSRLLLSTLLQAKLLGLAFESG